MDEDNVGRDAEIPEAVPAAAPPGEWVGEEARPPERDEAVAFGQSGSGYYGYRAEGGSALFRGTGSPAFTAAARVDGERGRATSLNGHD